VAQDVALSRPKRGFEFLWGHKNNSTDNKTKQNEDPQKGVIFEFLWGHKNNSTHNKTKQNEDPQKGVIFEFLYPTGTMWGHTPPDPPSRFARGAKTAYPHFLKI